VSINGRSLRVTREEDGSRTLSGYPGYGPAVGKAVEGSVIITLYKEFLATLQSGTHTLSVSFAEDTVLYAEPQTTFEIKRTAPVDDTPSTPQQAQPTTTVSAPQTGDDSNMTGWAIALLAAMGGLIGVAAWRKRRQSNGTW
jgi:LPXTG-motif cell wall-anchored protein